MDPLKMMCSTHVECAYRDSERDLWADGYGLLGMLWVRFISPYAKESSAHNVQAITMDHAGGPGLIS